MDLKIYDNTCVRIIDAGGNAFDGICQYYNAAYNEHEYARDEDSLKIENFIFYPGDIREIQSLENHTGPYGRFLDPYGKLEEMNVEDGIDGVEDILFSEENEHVLRMLNCLDKYLDPDNGYELLDRRGVLELLSKLLSYNSDETIQRKARHLLEGRTTMELKCIDADFSVCKVIDYSEADLTDEYCFIGKTDEENSLVCLTDSVPANVTERDDGWKAFRIQGVLDISLIGILSKISGILADHKIGIFALSTFNTDYILIKRENHDKAIAVLSAAGYKIL